MMSKVLIFSPVQCVEGGRISVIGRDVFKCVSILNPNLKGQCVKFSKFNHRFNGSNGLRI